MADVPTFTWSMSSEQKTPFSEMHIIDEGFESQGEVST